jgi:hypothetical protein
VMPPYPLCAGTGPMSPELLTIMGLSRAKPDVVVRIRPRIVQVHRGNASVRRVVPVGATIRQCEHHPVKLILA